LGKVFIFEFELNIQPLNLVSITKIEYKSNAMFTVFFPCGRDLRAIKLLLRKKIHKLLMERKNFTGSANLYKISSEPLHFLCAQISIFIAT
jgi:hypothetical protein